MLFLGIISWKVTSRFNGGVCFSDGGDSFLSRTGMPHGGHWFCWRGVEKNCRIGGGNPEAPGGLRVKLVQMQ